MSFRQLTPAFEEPIRLFRPEQTGRSLPDQAARQLALLGLLAIVLLVLGGGAYALWAGRQADVAPPGFFALVRPLDRGMVQPAERAPERVLPDRLREARANYTQTFTGIVTPPSAVCDALAEAGFDSSGWTASPAGNSRSECTLTYQPGPDEGAGGASLFAVIRGTDRGGIDTVLVKLNLLDQATSADITEKATKFLAILGKFADIAPPPAIVRAVAARGAVDLPTFSARFRFAPERTDPQRYNLTIRYLRGRTEAWAGLRAPGQPLNGAAADGT